MTLLLLFIAALCVTSTECNFLEEEISIGLIIDPGQLQESGNCCPVGDSQPCNEEDCPALNTDEFRNIADGSAITEWVIGFVSENTPNSPSAEIVFNLGQVYPMIAE
jgi:hypothetical protein